MTPDIERLTQFIANEFSVDERELTPTLSLFEKNILDSMNLVQLMGFLETSYGVKIQPRDLIVENFDTIEAIIRFVRRPREV